MASHRSFAAVTALALLAVGCGLATSGLSSPELAVDVEAGVEDTPPTIDAASAVSLPEGSPEASPVFPESPAQDGMDEGSNAEFADAAVTQGFDASKTLDAGLPNEFAVGPGTATKQWGDSPASSLYNVACPAGEVIFGFMGTVSTSQGYWIDIAAECGTPSFEPGIPAVTIMPGLTLPAEGPPPPMGGTMPAHGECPPNEVVVGFTAQDTPEGHIHGITLDCASLTIESAGNLSAEWSTAAIVTRPAGGAVPGNDPQLASPDIRCVSDPPAVASQTNNGFDDLGLVVFGLECGTLTEQ
jgi:hypothetical protein